MADLLVGHLHSPPRAVDLGGVYDLLSWAENSNCNCTAADGFDAEGEEGRDMTADPVLGDRGGSWYRWRTWCLARLVALCMTVETKVAAIVARTVLPSAVGC